VSRSVICAAVFGGIVVLTMFVWFVIVAPPIISFSLAVASAVAWCVWMEGNQERRGEHLSSQSWVFTQASTPFVSKKESS
jgi:hypothetical protein